MGCVGVFNLTRAVCTSERDADGKKCRARCALLTLQGRRIPLLLVLPALVRDTTNECGFSYPSKLIPSANLVAA